MRYLPLTDADRTAMLSAVGIKSIDDLFISIPANASFDNSRYDLPTHASEMAVEHALMALAACNLSAADAPCFLGCGIYRHHIPAVVDHLIQRGEFLTSYTPYQAEISQGTLQYLFEFQTQVALLTGMDVANASMYDGATACAEAVAMACRITGRQQVLLSGGLHPHYRQVTQTWVRPIGIQTTIFPPDPVGLEDLIGWISDKTSCVVVQNPAFFGLLKDYSDLALVCHNAGALLVIAVTEPVSLGLVKSPGAMGADIVVAEGQSLACPMNFGGPGLGLFATRDEYVRQIPGRLVGQTVDADGYRSWVLTLNAREQHIRRERATSNICTNAGLGALALSIHLSLLGEVGLVRLAELNHAAAVYLEAQLVQLRGCRIHPSSWFNEFTLLTPCSAVLLAEKLATRGILGGVPVARFYPELPELQNALLVTCTETNSQNDIEELILAIEENLECM